MATETQCGGEGEGLGGPVLGAPVRAAWGYRIARRIVLPIVRWWVELECRGSEHLPADGPLIIAANHVSYFEPLCVTACIDAAGRPVQFLAKAELFAPRLLGGAMRAMGQIPVHRHSPDASVALEAAAAALRAGGTVIVYPEGTTTRDPDFLPTLTNVKTGVARLAALTGAPVLPVASWGGHLLFTRYRFGPGPLHRGLRVVVQAGRPLHLGLGPEASAAQLSAARDLVMESILELLDEARRGWAPPPWYGEWAARHPPRQRRSG